jgi:serine/threonine protein kinase
VPALFKIANSKDAPEIPLSISKEGNDFLSLCLMRDPAQRPSATQLLGHPFVHDHQAIRAERCRATPLNNGLSTPVEAKHKKASSSFYKLSSHFSVRFPKILNISRYCVLPFPSTSKINRSLLFNSSMEMKSCDTRLLVTVQQLVSWLRIKLSIFFR